VLLIEFVVITCYWSLYTQIRWMVYWSTLRCRQWTDLVGRGSVQLYGHKYRTVSTQRLGHSQLWTPWRRLCLVQHGYYYKLFAVI